MVRRTIWFLLLFAVAAAIAGAAIAGGSEPGRPKTPSVTVPPIPSTSCFVAAQSCPVHPCVEFVIARPLIPQPRARLQTQTICEQYPNPGGRRLYVRR